MKAKTKKRKAKVNSTVDLVGGLRVVSDHIISENMKHDDRLIASCLINEVADRIVALVNLTSQQNKRIKELDAILRKVSK